jgi:hypothetical protein
MLAFSHQPRAEVVTPSWRRKWRFPGLGWAVCAVIAGTLQAAQAPADGPGDGAPVKRVLVLQSFGGDFAPYNALSSGFRSELAMALDVPVEFQEVSVFGTQSPDADVEEALIGYLRG